MNALRQHVRSFDRRFIDGAARLPGWSRPVMEFSSFIGQPYIMVMAGLELFGYGFRFGQPLALTGLAAVVLLPVSAGAKLLWRRVRPETAAALGLHNYSFPSGHSYGSVLVMGLLAEVWWSAGGPWLAAAWLLIALVACVGVSRVYLGAHYPSDVVAGWLLGGIVLAAVSVGSGVIHG
jgi:undecaprenyl-diphosphatase